MILIADAGSTKTTWSLVDPSDGGTLTFRTSGINPAVMPPDEIARIVGSELKPRVADAPVRSVFYYGAGIVTDLHRAAIASSLSFLTPDELEIESDMLGAARSLLRHNAGVAGILGTGSNSCCYDGLRITANIPPLGFILGDEGSGASIGKRFVGDLFKGLMPGEISRLWEERVGLLMGDVIDRVYRHPGANRFLASLMPVIKEASACEVVDRLIIDEFDRYFTRNIDRYGGVGAQLGFTGSVALHFRPQLERVALAHGYPAPAVCADPIEGLVDFHLTSA